MVCVIWVLCVLLWEYGCWLIEVGVFDILDDVFYFLVDEIDVLLVDVLGLVVWCCVEQCRFVGIVLFMVFSGSWELLFLLVVVLVVGDILCGVGVCGGWVCGWVWIVCLEIIDDLQFGEILVVEVIDVGYIVVFCYVVVVVIEFGGLMLYVVVVVCEFGFFCVVDVQGVIWFLLLGVLVEVDGVIGEIYVVELVFEDGLVFLGSDFSC